MSPTGILWKHACFQRLRAPSTGWIFAGFVALVALRFISALRLASGTIEHMPAVFCTQLLLCSCIPVALLTMGLFATERSQGTLETLLTAPISDAQVVVGKFLAAVTLVAIAFGLATLILPLYMMSASPAPVCSRPSLYAGVAVVGLVATTWCALGVLISLLLPHPAVAGFITALVSLLGSLVLTARVPGFWGRAILFSTDVADFARGTADTRILFAALSAIIFLLFCATRVLESRRWIASP